MKSLILLSWLIKLKACSDIIIAVPCLDITQLAGTHLPNSIRFFSLFFYLFIYFLIHFPPLEILIRSR
jgi:hypothetical protein